MNVQQALQEGIASCFGQITAVVQDLSDEQLGFIDARLDERSIAGVAMHAAGAMGFIIGFAAGGSGQRPAGGPPPPPSSSSALMQAIGQMRSQAEAQVGALTDEQLGRSLTMPWGERLSGAGAVQSASLHALRHVGTILDLRALGGFPTHVIG